jgi:hypothetical protein
MVRERMRRCSAVLVGIGQGMGTGEDSPATEVAGYL